MPCCRPLCPKGNEWDKAERMWNLRGPPFCKLPCTAKEWNRQWNTGKACEPTKAQSRRLCFLQYSLSSPLFDFQLRGCKLHKNSGDVRFDKDIHIDAADIAPTAPWTAPFSCWTNHGFCHPSFMLGYSVKQLLYAYMVGPLKPSKFGVILWTCVNKDQPLPAVFMIPAPKPVQIKLRTDVAWPSLCISVWNSWKFRFQWGHLGHQPRRHCPYHWNSARPESGQCCGM